MLAHIRDKVPDCIYLFLQRVKAYGLFLLHSMCSSIIIECPVITIGWKSLTGYKLK